MAHVSQGVVEASVSGDNYAFLGTWHECSDSGFHSVKAMAHVH